MLRRIHLHTHRNGTHDTHVDVIWFSFCVFCTTASMGMAVCPLKWCAAYVHLSCITLDGSWVSWVCESEITSSVPLSTAFDHFSMQPRHTAHGTHQQQHTQAQIARINRAFVPLFWRVSIIRHLSPSRPTCTLVHIHIFLREPYFFLLSFIFFSRTSSRALKRSFVLQ